MRCDCKQFRKNARLDKAEANARAAKQSVQSDHDPVQTLGWRKGEKGRKAR